MPSHGVDRAGVDGTAVDRTGHRAAAPLTKRSCGRAGVGRLRASGWCLSAIGHRPVAGAGHVVDRRRPTRPSASWFVAPPDPDARTRSPITARCWPRRSRLHRAHRHRSCRLLRWWLGRWRESDRPRWWRSSGELFVFLLVDEHGGPAAAAGAAARRRAADLELPVRAHRRRCRALRLHRADRAAADGEPLAGAD